MLLEVQCEVSEVRDDLGCRDICWCWSTVFYQVQSQCSHLPRNVRALHASSADKLYGDACFIFQQDFSTCPQSQKHLQVVCWPWYYGVWLASQHAWPEPQEYPRNGVFSRERWETVDPSWRLNSVSVESQADRFHVTPHWCWSLC